MEELQGVIIRVDHSRLSFAQLRLRHSSLEETIQQIDMQSLAEGDPDRIIDLERSRRVVLSELLECSAEMLRRDKGADSVEVQWRF